MKTKWNLLVVFVLLASLAGGIATPAQAQETHYFTWTPASPQEGGGGVNFTTTYSEYYFTQKWERSSNPGGTSCDQLIGWDDYGYSEFYQSGDYLICLTIYRTISDTDPIIDTQVMTVTNLPPVITQVYSGHRGGLVYYVTTEVHEWDSGVTCTVDYGDGTGPEVSEFTGYYCYGPDHEYAAAGTYEVIITLNETGFDPVSTTYSLDVVNPPVEHYFTWSPASPTVGEAVTFSSVMGIPPEGYSLLWTRSSGPGGTVCDETIGTEAAPVTSFAAAGDYKVCLAAFYLVEQIGFDSQIVTVVGAVSTYTISGTMFNDLNSDGMKDTGEEPLLYWPLELDQGCDGSSEFYIYTDELGQLSFAGLTAGLCYRLDTNPYDDTSFEQTTTVGDIILDADKSFEIGMHYSGLVFTPERFLPGDKDVLFDQTMTVSGGTPPYTITINEEWTVMPPGVTYTIVDNTITVSGTPTEAGFFVIEFTVEDSAGVSLVYGSGILIRGADATFTLTSALNPSVLGQEATFALEGIGLDPDNMYLTPRGLVTFYDGGSSIEGCVDLPMDEGYWDDSSQMQVVHNPVECKTAALTLGDHIITADFDADPEGLYNSATGLVLEGGHTVVATGYTISGITFNDLNLDGVMDEGEAGVADATVRLDAGCDGSVNLSLSTAADGSYSAVLPGGFCYSLSAFGPSMKQTAAVAEIASLAADTGGVNIGLVEVVLAVDPASLPDGIAGEPYNQTLTVSGGTAPYTFNLDLNLPEGLDYAVDENAGTLTISGTPTELYYGYAGGSVQDASGASLDFGFSFYIKVKVNLTFNSAPNPSAPGETVTFSLGISGPDGELVAGTVEFYDGAGDLAGCEQTFEVIYGTTLVECSTASLPEGLHQLRATYDPGIEGSIYAHTETTLEHLVAAPVTIAVGPATIPQGQVGVAYSQQFTASGGTAPYTFASTSTLPSGLSLSAGGLLSGTPTEAGDFPITVTATDAAEQTGSGSYTLTINSEPLLTLMPETLPGGYVGGAYSAQLTAANGTGPYTFSLLDSNLPSGLSLSGDTISGTPFETGTWSFTIQVTDSSSPAKTASRGYTIDVIALTISGTTFTDTNRNGILDSGEVGLPHMEIYFDLDCDGTIDGWAHSDDQGIYTSDPLAPYQKYCVNAWQMSGFTRTSQPVTIDSLTESITGLNFGFVENSLVVTPTSLPNGELNVQYNQTVTVSGGTGTYTFAPDGADLPAGLSYSFDGSTGVFTISGKPSELGEAWIVGVVRDANLDEAAIEIHFAIRAGLTFTFTSSPNPSMHGQEVIFSFTATAPPGGQYPDPIGDVTLYDGDDPIYECIGLPLGGSEGGTNPVTCTTSALGAGTHTITAQYYDYTGAYNDAYPTLEQVVNADTTPPVITYTIDGTKGQNDWYITDVTLTWSVTDPDTAITSQDGCNPVTITSDQQATDYTCTATSGGGISSVTATIKRDATAPTVTLTADRNPDVGGWYNHAINFTVNGTDATSGIGSCDPDSTYSGPDSATAVVSASCTDPAGNTGSSDPFPFQYDGTGPVVTVTADRDPNANGWYNSSIGFTASGTDATSGGVTCSEISDYSGPDGTGLTAGGICTDAAGNMGSGWLFFKYDATPPTATITPQRDPDSNGWYNHEIGFITSGTDALSGGVTCDPIQYASADGASLSVIGTCTDQAGNTGTSEEFEFKYDGTPPTVTITADRDPDAYGWYNHEIGFTASGTDATSGGVTCGPISSYSGPDSATASVSGACSDLAGNEGTSSYDFKYDGTKPVVTLTGVTEGSVYVQGSVPVVGCTTTDALAGVLTQAALNVTGGNPDGTGNFTATCSGALDNAGNLGDSAIVHYTVNSPSSYILTIDKTTNGADGLYILAGAPVTWQYVVTNVSSGNLTSIIVTDNILGQVCRINKLAPQASRTCMKTGVAVAGPYTNTGTATVVSGGTTYTASDDSSYFGAAPAIDVEKLVSVDLGATWEDADSPTGPNVIVGDPVQFKFIITNTGNVELSNITLSDTDLSLPACSVATTLAAGSPYECVVEIPATIGQHTNTATTTGDYGGITYTDSDNANYHGGNVIQPDIAINSLTITINKARTTVSGQFVITDETEDGTAPDGFLIDLTDYGMDWEAKAAKAKAFAPVVPSGGCTYSIVTVDYEQAAGWQSGDPITFDESVTIAHTCTFGETQLPAGGTLRGTAWSYIFDQMDMKYTYIATKVIPK